MEKKSIEVNVKYADEGNGTLEGYASTWIKEPDSYGDIVKEGAFTKTLAERWNGGKNIPLLWAHQMDNLNAYIGKADADEDEKGLHFIAQFDASAEAQKVRQMYKDGRLRKFSFAFNVIDNGPVTLEDGRKANELRELDLFEISAVCVPANEDAAVVEVKEADAEVKSGKRNSKADYDRISKAISLLKEVIDEIDDIEEALEEGEDETEANACKPRKDAEEQKSEVNPEEQKRLLNLINRLKGDSDEG